MLHSRLAWRGQPHRHATSSSWPSKDMRECFDATCPIATWRTSRRARSTSTTTSKPCDWAQEYALLNRELMMEQIVARRAACGELPAVHARAWRRSTATTTTWRASTHFGENVLITRKGAVRAREGDLGIIPGSMGARSYIVRGKGNPESFYSLQPRRRARDVARRSEAPLHRRGPRARDGRAWNAARTKT